jgi:hypothetical protein
MGKTVLLLPDKVAPKELICVNTSEFRRDMLYCFALERSDLLT